MIVDVVVSRSTKKLYAQQFNRRDLHAKENVSTDMILISVYALNEFIFISRKNTSACSSQRLEPANVINISYNIQIKTLHVRKSILS